MSPSRNRILAVSVAFAGLLTAAVALWPWPRSLSTTADDRPGPFCIVWTFEQVERGAILAAPLVAGDFVYVAAIQDAGFQGRGVVHCLRRDTGKWVWTFDGGGTMRRTYSTPCLADGRLYVGEGMHADHVCNFYCLDAVTGREQWHVETAGHIESSPCAAAGRVFVGAGDDGVYGLDAASGKELWHYRGPVHVDSRLAVQAGCVFAGSGVSRLQKEPSILCLDAATGAERWRLPTDLPVWGSPVVSAGRVFVGLGNGRLTQSAEAPEKPAGAVLCVDAPTGQRIWRYDVADAVFARPAVNLDRVYFTARTGFCYALARGDGRLCWQHDLGSPVMTAPALGGGGVYVVASGGRVCRLAEADGRIERQLDVAALSGTTPLLFSSPVVSEEAVGRRIYFGAELKNPVSSAAVVYGLGEE